MRKNTLLIVLGVIIIAIVVGLKMNSQLPKPIDQNITPVEVLPTVNNGSTTSNKAVDTKIKPLSSYTEAEWKAKLTPQQFSVLREQGTETPFTSDLLHETRKGTFVTADCGEAVFRSEQKFDSGTGWPSFYAPIKNGAVVIKNDSSLGMNRDEVETPICHSHLGHLFHDAPQTPTGDRYCINGVAIKFIPDAVQ